MMGGQAFTMAAGSLWAHKTRSLLTILGVVIGIGSVLTIVTLGASFEASVIGQFDSVDDRTVFVTVGQDGPQQGPPTAGPFGTIFTAVDRDALAALPGVERVEASGTVATSSVTFGSTTIPYTAVRATDGEAQELRHPEDYADGRVFTLGTREVVLGANIAQFLGKGNLSAGDTVVFTLPDGSDMNVTVAGILREQEGVFSDSNTGVFVPLDPFYDFRIRSPTTQVVVSVFNGLTVIASSASELDTVRDAVNAYMQDSSDASQLLTEGTVIFVATAGDITEQISAVFDQITIFIASIAVVSLLVGAIGIANIMLVAVTERTREIGVMKAIGALDRQVLGLFLMESILVGVVGSIVGIGLGLAGGIGLVKGLFSGTDVPLTIPYEWLAISVLVGIGVGVIAGYLPARRATKIQPVEALAHE